MTNKMIIPAILSTDGQIATEQIRQFDGLVDFVQLDVVDGQFASPTTCRPRDIKNLLGKTKLELHLMVASPLAWVDECLAANAARVYLQVESNPGLDVVLAFKQKGMEVFLALNPETPIEAFAPFKDLVDGCLFLSVHPGKQGQEFIQAVFEKIVAFREMFADKVIVVDGGVNENNIKPLIAAGADWLVIGSSIIKSENPIDAYKKFLALL